MKKFLKKKSCGFKNNPVRVEGALENDSTSLSQKLSETEPNTNLDLKLL